MKERFHFSAHSDRESLFSIAERLRPSRVILVHGDPSALEWLASAINERLPGTTVHTASEAEPIPLD